MVFARPEQILDDFTLFGKDGVTEWDVKQGLIGNCWWMAGCIAVSQNPSRIENIFLNRGISEAGIYSVQLYALNVPITITVDDKLPVTETSDEGFDTIYGHIGRDGSIWSALLEKALAKYYGNYARIEGG